MQNSNSNSKSKMSEHEQLDCPRCGSNNTKFCYYNNYNLAQPRHFCKNCRRYWTKGGALRYVPIGGGTRKQSSKRLARRQLTKPATSAAMSATPVEDPAVQPQPVPTAVYQPVITSDPSGYIGNFNFAIAGLPLSVREVQSSAESSGGENEVFLNGDLNYFYGGW